MLASCQQYPRANPRSSIPKPCSGAPQMSVDDLVARHIDPDTPPRDWRLVVPWTGSGGPHQGLTERQLLEVATFVQIPLLAFDRPSGAGSSGPHQTLTQAQLLEVGTVSALILLACDSLLVLDAPISIRCCPRPSCSSGVSCVTPRSAQDAMMRRLAAARPLIATPPHSACSEDASITMLMSSAAGHSSSRAALGVKAQTPNLTKPES